MRKEVIQHETQTYNQNCIFFFRNVECINGWGFFTAEVLTFYCIKSKDVANNIEYVLFKCPTEHSQ